MNAVIPLIREHPQRIEIPHILCILITSSHFRILYKHVREIQGILKVFMLECSPIRGMTVIFFLINEYLFSLKARMLISVNLSSYFKREIKVLL